MGKVLNFEKMSVVMEGSEICDSIQIHKEKRLFLKQIARMIVVVQLPELKTPGYSISNWEVMEKLKSSICPNVFSYIKVIKTSLEFLHFEAEAESKELLQKFITALDGKAIKLSGIAECLKVKAGRAKTNFPKKHDWIIFFRDSKTMDESKPGERPDTVHIKGLPIKWFSNENKGSLDMPSERLVSEFFETFGPVRSIDIPLLDKYRPRMELQVDEGHAGFKTFSFGSNLYFEAFVQFMDYTGFENAMNALKGRKLVHVLEDEKIAAANIEVNFDCTSHLSEKNIKKRDFVRKKIIQFDMEQMRKAEEARQEEEKRKEMEIQEKIRKEEEEKRAIEKEKQLKKQKKNKALEKKKVNKLKLKLLQHEKRKYLKLLEKQKIEMDLERKREAKILVNELIKTVSEKKREEELEKEKREKELQILKELEKKKLKRDEEEKLSIEIKVDRKKQLEHKEKGLRLKLLKNLEEMEETKKELQRELLRRKLSSTKKPLNSVVSCSSK